MKTMVLKNPLLEGLIAVEKIPTKSSILPILNTILLVGKANMLQLKATDLEIGLTYQILAKNEKEGSVVIPSRTLSQFIETVPEDRVILTSKENQLEIETGNFHALLKTFNVDDFPIIPSLKGDEECIEISNKTLYEGLSSVIGFVGQSQTRPEISGVLFWINKQTLTLVSTDSFRLAERTLTLAKEYPKDFSFILPSKTCRELISLFANKTGFLKIYLSPSQIIFDYMLEGSPEEPKIQLVSRIIEGEYPRYQEVIPTRFQTQAVLQRNKFINHIKAASFFSGKMNDIKLFFNPLQKRVEFSTKNIDFGEQNSFLEGDIQGEKVEISFNWRFLEEGLSQIQTDQVQFNITSSEGPALLKPVGKGGYFYLLMPIKV